MKNHSMRLEAGAAWMCAALACGQSNSNTPSQGSSESDGGGSEGTASEVGFPGCASAALSWCIAGMGLVCQGGVNPGGQDSSLACSAAVADPNGGSDYCCTEACPGCSPCFTSDQATRACPPGSIGFECTGGYSPVPLNCSNPDSDPNPNTIYQCCN
jgi:hypothetical protein